MMLEERESLWYRVLIVHCGEKGGYGGGRRFVWWQNFNMICEGVALGVGSCLVHNIKGEVSDGYNTLG